MARKICLTPAKKREILKTYRVFFAKEKAGKGFISLTRVNSATATAAGVSLSSVTRVLRENRRGEFVEKKKGSGRKKKFDAFDLAVLRRSIHNMYKNKILPTITQITDDWNSDFPENKASKSTIHRYVRELGFRYTRTPDSRVLLFERPDVIDWRNHYLRTVAASRSQGYTVVYLDETWVHQFQTNPYRWADADGKCGLIPPNSNGRRLILLHAGSAEDGFIPGCKLVFQAKRSTGDYHNEMNQTHFGEWFIQTLLPALERPSVIVMDLAPYHRERVMESVPPTTASKKGEMVQWLSNKGLMEGHFHKTKKQLYDIIKEHKGKVIYKLEEEAHKAGHKVLWLPPKHCELNPIEMVWSVVKRRVGNRNKLFKFKELEMDVNSVLDGIGKEIWEAEVSHVLKIEQKMSQNIINQPIQPVIINVEDESEETSS